MKTKTKIFGTLGPACHDSSILCEMLKNGMTGVRLNLSHVTIKESMGWIDEWHRAIERSGVKGFEPDLLIDMQGPEMRVASFKKRMHLSENQRVNIPVPGHVIQYIEKGQELLLDDGKILCEVTEIPASGHEVSVMVKRGGFLSGGKSLKIVGEGNHLPALTEHDLYNLRHAMSAGVTGVMQPFVRGGGDLRELRDVMHDERIENLSIYAKIENRAGLEKLDEILVEADWIVFARGDLGNDIPLWELPGAQRRVSKACRGFRVPFIVVTQMLASMEHSAVPTRAEISDIDHAVLDGAGGVMVTGETAVGEHPVEVIKYLVNTVVEAEKDFGEKYRK